MCKIINPHRGKSDIDYIYLSDVGFAPILWPFHVPGPGVATILILW